MNPNEGIGQRLREERSRLGLTQSEFAAIAGVGKNAQSNYEKNERSPDSGYLAAIAAEGVDVLYVITGVRSGAIALKPDEEALLDNYRHASEEGRASLESVSKALAAQTPRKKGSQSG